MSLKGNLGPTGEKLPAPDVLLLSYTGCFTFMKWFEAIGRSSRKLGPTCQRQVEMSAFRPSRNVRFVAVETTRPSAGLPAPVRDAAAPSLEA